MNKHLNIKVYGLVQRVFFRVTAKEQADKLGLTGFAQNLSDGSVYIEVEGEEKDLKKFLVWCKKGPANAQVEHLEIKKGPVKNFKEFTRDFVDY